MSIWKDPKKELPKEGSDVLIFFSTKENVRTKCDIVSTGEYIFGSFEADGRSCSKLCEDMGLLPTKWAYQDNLIKQAMDS